MLRILFTCAVFVVFYTVRADAAYVIHVGRRAFLPPPLPPPPFRVIIRHLRVPVGGGGGGYTIKQSYVVFYPVVVLYIILIVKILSDRIVLVCYKLIINYNKRIESLGIIYESID